MLFCEKCRIKKKWNIPPTYPFHNHATAQCEICTKHSDCYDYPLLFMKPKSELTLEEKQLDKVFQHEYHQKCEELIIAYASGRQAGSIDHERSDELKRVLIMNNGEVDWYATYELRLKVQQGYRKVDESKRNRR